ncbi:MAG: UDP-3-O-acyl-N-acetylglucosamine deacetylase [Isosphaera sp.]|nr:UDP-3-O-acyl-N-acetylglucosamine deacetylase [Isosphaera sp.]
MPTPTPPPIAPAPGWLVPRRTLARPVSWAGVGLFDPATSSVEASPVTEPTGIVFELRPPAGPSPVTFALSLDHALGGSRHTVVGVAGVAGASVATVEHLLSALWGMGVTDAHLRVAGPEVPALDGSALPFARAIGSAGLRPLGERPAAVVREPIYISVGPASITAEPLPPGSPPALGLRYQLEYDAPAAGLPPPIGPLHAGFSIDWAAPDGAAYAEAIAPARTFATAAEAQALRAAGQFAHLSPSDVLVLGPAGPLAGALRMADEPARHKLLDMIGDLALLGRPLVGLVSSHRGGHALNRALAAEIHRRGW